MKNGDKEPDSRETPNILNSRVMIVLDSAGSCRVGTGGKGSTREAVSMRLLSRGTGDKEGPGLRRGGGGMTPGQSPGSGPTTLCWMWGVRPRGGSRLQGGGGMGWGVKRGVTVGARGYHRLSAARLSPWTMAPPPGSPSRTGASLGDHQPPAPWPSSTEQPIRLGASSHISAASPAPSTGFGHSLSEWPPDLEAPEVEGGRDLVCLSGRGRREGKR